MSNYTTPTESIASARSVIEENKGKTLAPLVSGRVPGKYIDISNTNNKGRFTNTTVFQTNSNGSLKPYDIGDYYNVDTTIIGGFTNATFNITIPDGKKGTVDYDGSTWSFNESAASGLSEEDIDKLIIEKIDSPNGIASTNSVDFLNKILTGKDSILFTEIGKAIVSDGSYYPSSSFNSTAKQLLKSGTTIFFGLNCENNSSSGAAAVCLYDSSQNFTSLLYAQKDFAGTFLEKSYTATTDCYIGFCDRSTEDSINTPYVYTKTSNVLMSDIDSIVYEGTDGSDKGLYPIGSDGDSIIISSKTIEYQGKLTGFIINSVSAGDTIFYILQKNADTTYSILYSKSITVVAGVNTFSITDDVDLEIGYYYGVKNTVSLNSKDSPDGTTYWATVKLSSMTVTYGQPSRTVLIGAVNQLDYNIENTDIPTLAKTNELISTNNDAIKAQQLANGISDTWDMSIAVKPNLFNGENATKIGVILGLNSDTAAFDAGQVESPCIWWDANIGKYVMIYTAYSNATTPVGSVGYAYSDDLITWTRQGQLFKGKINGTADAYGCTGPVMIYYKGTYYLFYIGLASAGYEGEPTTICLATNTTLSPTGWVAKGVKINTNVATWASTTIYHANFVLLNSVWYMFFNAKGSGAGGNSERTGFATCDSLDGNWIVNQTAISDFAQYDPTITCGDPSLFTYKDIWYMFYCSTVSGGALDRWAWTSKSEFPNAWKYGGIAINKVGTYDSQYAHKPYCLKANNKLYHFYTAVGDQGRVIALQTFDL